MLTPRQYSLVRYTGPVGTGHPLVRGQSYIYLGEIPNMPGHVVVFAHQTGRIFSGYHIDNFVEMTEDEV